MSSLPVISANTDAIMRHQAKFITSAADIVIFGTSETRQILLALKTTGASVGIGVGYIGELQIGIGDDSEDNFTGDLVNLPVLVNTVSVLIDDVVKGTDDGAGNITGATISAGTVDYSIGAVDVTFTAPPAQDEVITVTYTGFDVSSYRNIVGAAPLDLSGFLKNAPFSFYKENGGLIVSPEAGEETAIAYIEMRERE